MSAYPSVQDVSVFAYKCVRVRVHVCLCVFMCPCVRVRACTRCTRARPPMCVVTREHIYTGAMNCTHVGACPNLSFHHIDLYGPEVVHLIEQDPWDTPPPLGKRPVYTIYNYIQRHLFIYRDTYPYSDMYLYTETHIHIETYIYIQRHIFHT